MKSQVPYAQKPTAVMHYDHRALPCNMVGGDERIFLDLHNRLCSLVLFSLGGPQHDILHKYID